MREPIKHERFKRARSSVAMCQAIACLKRSTCYRSVSTEHWRVFFIPRDVDSCEQYWPYCRECGSGYVEDEICKVCERKVV